VTRYTVFGKATKCPNCHAYLTGQGDVVRCEYCGVTVTVELPQREPSAGSSAVPVPIRAPEPTEIVRPARTPTRWPWIVMAPLMTGGILTYTYFMQKQAMERSEAIADRARSHAAAIRDEAQARASTALPGGDERPSPEAPAAKAADPICHLSAMELSQTLDQERKVVAACFADAPRKVKTVSADLTLVVEPSGAVSDVEVRWDGWKPDLKARKCATRKIKAWQLPRPSGDVPTRCQARLTLEPP